MTTLYFTDQAKRAAEHLIATPFGVRLEQVAEVSPPRQPYLAIVLPDGVTDRLSTGETVMLGALAGFATGLVSDGPAELAFRPHDLHLVDDEHWDALVVALFIARGRAFAVETVA